MSNYKLTEKQKLDLGLLVDWELIYPNDPQENPYIRECDKYTLCDAPQDTRIETMFYSPSMEELLFRTVAYLHDASLHFHLDNRMEKYNEFEEFKNEIISLLEKIQGKSWDKIEEVLRKK